MIHNPGGSEVLRTTHCSGTTGTVFSLKLHFTMFLDFFISTMSYTVILFRGSNVCCDVDFNQMKSHSLLSSSISLNVHKSSLYAPLQHSLTPTCQICQTPQPK